MIATRSQYSASSMKCVVTITVTPCSASAVIRCQNSRRASGSTPLVGSSKNRISGSCINAAAIARRCLYPPGNCPLGKRFERFQLELLEGPVDAVAARVCPCSP